jgi:hypothetical protein
MREKAMGLTARTFGDDEKQQPQAQTSDNLREREGG